ncbi:DUF4142 domain-containing protein [Kaistella polysaccharea]|uniref:DUF4142 domain-containing protein n=1 Tax=Kaistella polysaccharea TaxID=2878534 RepID=UPI001CF4BF6F|nr:DUF4142 domain-containing protein [Kaistella polysaccharea]
MKTLKNLALSGTMLLIAVSLSTNVNAQDPKTPKLTDPEIASVAVVANQIDVDYAQIALKKSTNKEVKNFANTMKRDHAAVIDMAVKLVTKLNVTPETNDVSKSLLAGAAKEKATLNMKKGHAFDKAYIDNEVSYHEAVINAVEKMLIPQAQNAELKALLVKIMPTLQMHLDHAKMVQKGFNTPKK